MATDGPTPSPCNPEIFQKGSGVCVLTGSSNALERWVRAVAEKADAQMDWHFSGGRANVLHLGDDESRKRAMEAIEELKGELEGEILQVGGPALFRNGVEDPDAQGAFINVVDGEYVLHDPAAVGVIKAVSKHNCKGTLEINAERIEHFKGRLAELGKTPEEAVIVLLNVDDANGAQIADALMPNHDWDAIRAKDEIPFARGIAMREGIQKALAIFDESASEKLRSFEGVAVVVVDHGVAEVFAA